VKHAVKVGSDGIINIPSFTTIGSGIQVTLKFCLRNFRGCNIDIACGRDL
jgi:uncharacterized protein YraI